MAAGDAPIRAVLFDHDGTLVDSEPVHLALWQEVLAPLGVALDLPTYKACHAGIPTPANAVDMVRRFGLALTPQTLAGAKHEATARWLARQPFPLMPSARGAVQRLRAAGLRLAIVTGAEGAGARRTLRGHGLEGLFDTVVSGDDVARSKPAPDCYRLALERLGLPAEACVALEDTAAGLHAATEAGLRALAIPHALSAHQDLGRAHLRVADLGEAADWVLARSAARC